MGRRQRPCNSFTHCIDVDWPANGVWRNLNEKPTQFHPRRSWMGSLLRHGRDASGQYHRRNRCYGAGTGRFTQEPHRPGGWDEHYHTFTQIR